MEFEATSYFEKLLQQNRLAQREGFVFCRISSIDGAEELVSSMRRETSFFAITESVDGSASDNGSGYSRRKIYTCFILRRFRTGDEKARREAMDVCAQLRDELYSRMLVDALELESSLIYLGVSTIYEHELPTMLLNGCCGLFFTFNLDVPLSLEYNPDAWQSS